MGEAPVEYKDAYGSLVIFRKKIFGETVSGRVKALLDANHDTLGKYGDVIDRLSIVPYMFGNVRQKALALKLGGKDVGMGEIAQSKANFAIDKGTYPLSTPFNVPQRKLPQVDVFMYEPPTDATLIEKTTEEVWSSLFLLQSDKNVFADVPDVENAFFDYFKFKPVGRVKIEATLSEPQSGFDVWNKLSGEATVLVREVALVGGEDYKVYSIFVFVDANYYSTAEEVGVVPLVLFITPENVLNPSAVIIAGGKRLLNTDEGVFASWVVEGQLIGFTKTHGSYEVTKMEYVKVILTLLTISVNDSSMGTTSPAPAVYKKASFDEVTVTAIPYTGCAVKNWELDGVQYPPSDTFLVKCYRDHELICVFWVGGTLAIRPMANGDVIELWKANVNYNWEAVDEEISDGGTTFVFNGVYGTRKYDLYTLINPNIPEGAIIDSVEMFVRVKRGGTARAIRANIVSKTHGTVYHEKDWYAPSDWNWHLISKKYEVNPYTNNAWTTAEVFALQVGVRLEAIYPTGDPCATDVACTQLWAEVRYHTEAPSPVMSDNFNDNMLDPNNWLVKKLAKATEIDVFERNQRLEIALNINDAGTSPKAGVRTKYLYDFSGKIIQTDFYIPNGVHDYARCHLILTPEDIPENIETDPRTWLQENNKDAYCISATPKGIFLVKITNGTSTLMGSREFGQQSYTGKFRITRIPEGIIWEYYKDGVWTEIQRTLSMFSEGQGIYTYLWAEDNLARSKNYGETDTWFDNFSIVWS